MNPGYVLFCLASSFQQVRGGWPERPDREIGGMPSIGALRLAEREDSAVRRSVGWTGRWRQRRTAIRALRALGDHHPTDIGPDRCQIASSLEQIVETGGPSE